MGRFRVADELARGGMGVVVRAHEPAIGRDVAVKVLRDRYRGDPRAAARFVAEARITGRLQHPAVPPVFEVGELPDGSPFPAVKLIDGDTLAALLDRRPTPAHDRPRFVVVFEHVCHAVGYAHSKGIVHRDLKPANVMVGSFGEVQVMDWGLAKVLAGSTGTAPVGPDDNAPGAEVPEHRRVVGRPAGRSGTGSHFPTAGSNRAEDFRETLSASSPGLFRGCIPPTRYSLPAWATRASPCTRAPPGSFSQAVPPSSFSRWNVPTPSAVE